MGVQSGMDVLGRVAGELGTLEKGVGQFFTPFEVSKLMAAIIMSDVDKPGVARGDTTEGS